MNPEQKIAYVNAQTACMLAELEAMKAANRERQNKGYSDAYGYEAFAELPDKFNVSHNYIINLFLDI